MKTIKEIIKQKPVFLNDWAEGCKVDLISDFEDIYMSKKEYEAEVSPYPNVKAWEEKKVRMTEQIKAYEDKNILFASYGCACYEGDAWVLFEQNSLLFEVNGSHCSCYGLEHQWEPEDITLKELENRLVNGSFGVDDYSGNGFANELRVFLGV
ncbi:MAG: hypothetical protein QNK20_16725 [Aureibaculum sp.]|nr:hypothetical protein [Aureibaculum sp.]